MGQLSIGFFASHNGSNLQAIVDAIKDGRLAARAAVVIGNNSSSGALQRARAEGIPACHLSSATHPDPDSLDSAMLAELQRHSVNLIVLAGYMKRLGPRVLSTYKNRVLNIHPALLPKHGGQGFYGQRVHEAVLAAGETETGVTIHLVDAEYDTGPILSQTRVPVSPNDTVETLAARVLVEEHRAFVATLKLLINNDL